MNIRRFVFGIASIVLILALAFPAAISAAPEITSNSSAQTLTILSDKQTKDLIKKYLAKDADTIISHMTTRAIPDGKMSIIEKGKIDSSAIHPDTSNQNSNLNLGGYSSVCYSTLMNGVMGQYTVQQNVIGHDAEWVGFGGHFVNANCLQCGVDMSDLSVWYGWTYQASNGYDTMAKYVLPFKANVANRMYSAITFYSNPDTWWIYTDDMSTGTYYSVLVTPNVNGVPLYIARHDANWVVEVVTAPPPGKTSIGTYAEVDFWGCRWEDGNNNWQNIDSPIVDTLYTEHQDVSGELGDNNPDAITTPSGITNGQIFYIAANFPQ